MKGPWNDSEELMILLMSSHHDCKWDVVNQLNYSWCILDLCNWGVVFLPVWTGGGQQAASWPGRQRRKKAVSLWNKLIWAFMFPKVTTCHAVLWCTVRQCLGLGTGTLTSGCTLTVVGWDLIAQWVSSAHVFIGLAQSIFFSHGNQHDKEKVTLEDSLTRFCLVGGRRAGGQRLWWL